jgi:hypothetical protein
MPGFLRNVFIVLSGAELPTPIEARRAIGELKTDLMAHGEATDLPVNCSSRFPGSPSRR